MESTNYKSCSFITKQARDENCNGVQGFEEERHNLADGKPFRRTGFMTLNMCMW